MPNFPLITIVGVPNTGKSTLFNRLIGQRKALIHSSPGMTRDIFQKTFKINNKVYNIQDTGGFFLDQQIITEEINKRIFREVKNSDLIIFIFDGKRELLGYEKDLFLEIKKLNKNIIPVINKIDDPDKVVPPASYYSLKLDALNISAEHKIGLEDLLERIEKELAHVPASSDKRVDPGVRISIMGKPNVGKSSLINKILNDEQVIVTPIPGTTRDSIDLEIKRNNKIFVLVDNAGIRKLKKVKESTESAAVLRAERDIREADIVIFVLDISKKIDQNDLFIAHRILKSAKPVIIAANKWDLVLDKEDHQKLINKVKKAFNFLYFAPFIFTSAKTGKNVFHLIDKSELINQKLKNKIKTSYLNQKVQDILKERKLLTESNQHFNPKYISIESYRPFFITFFTSSKYKLKSFFEKYLKKRISEELRLEGIPIFFKISTSIKKRGKK
jgi:GTP-binding protein